MMPTFLFAIYSIHLAVFAFFWWRRREAVYGVLAATFVLLLVSHTLRTVAPELRVGAIAAYWPPRIASWIGAALGLVLLVSRRLKQRRESETS